MKVELEELEELEELFGKHFNGMHWEDITKEMMMKFAEEYAKLKVEEEKECIREMLIGEDYEMLAEGI